MKLDSGSVLKPVRNLRRSLKSLPKLPSVAAVHDLRTRTRRIEAIVATLPPGPDKLTRRLLKAIQPISAAAGKVRDMDVLADKVLALTGQRHDDSVLRLFEHLQAMRIENARQLRATVSEQRKDARRLLKRFSRQLEKRFIGCKSLPATAAAGAQPDANAATGILSELCQWPAFTAQNLHPFRIKVKELAYILQLAADRNMKFIRALGKVRKQIGDWHDWQRLARIAQEVLDLPGDRMALKKIEEITRQKLNQALAAAQALKTRYLSSSAKAGAAPKSRAPARST
jgi:CHAD domain-containing protein